MVKRKLDGTVDESSGIKKFINETRLYITCEKSGGLHLEHSGTQSYGRLAGWLAGRLTKFGRGLNIEKFAVDRKFDFPLCLANV